MNASKCELTHIKLFLECFLKFLFPASLSSFVTFISVIKHIKLLSVRVCVINLWCKSVTQAMLAAIRSRGSLFLFSLLIFQHSFVRLRKFKCNFFFVLHCRGNFVFPLQYTLISLQVAIPETFQAPHFIFALEFLIITKTKTTTLDILHIRNDRSHHTGKMWILAENVRNF